MSDNRCGLCVVSLGLALGITWGLGLFITALGASCFDWGDAFIAAMASVYIGYAATLLGSFLGLFWGFVDGFVCGVILAWLYNKFSNCCAKCCAKRDK